VGTALVGARVFDGDSLRVDRAVVLEGDRVAGVVPLGKVPSDAKRVDCSGGILAPGFVDVQVNGGGGVLFNDVPSLATLETMVVAHRRHGTTAMVPTLISDRWSTMVAAAEAVAEARAAGLSEIVGIHFEGPYLNPARRGAHPALQLRGVDPGFVALAARKDLGAVVVTLAPECVPRGTIGTLVAAGVRVSLGHTEATYERAIAALDEGATGFTHLFNAMPPLRSREPGVVGAALMDPRGHRGVIVDGHHVDPIMLKLALGLRGSDAMMLVTDAMATVGSDRTTFELSGQTVTRASGRLTTADGTLAGSDLDMEHAVRNAVAWLGLSPEQALAMATRQPAAFLGLDHERGRLAAGTRADVLLLDDGLAVRRVWVSGRS
jgi:N-acetylglucosamine-6-phosphate deacetylase